MVRGGCYKRRIQTRLAACVALSIAGAALSLPVRAQQPSPAPADARLDFDTFRVRIAPILTSARRGNARCIACHARGNAISFLEPLSPGATSYTEEQARRTFDRIQRVVVPGQPLRSLLLINPLAEDAGGSRWHGGGKHWASQDHPEWRALADWVSFTAPAPASGVNYDVFKTRVQPILTGARKGNARCVACHARGNAISFLEPLTPGATVYSEEQSRRNFERIQRLLVPRNPEKSLLLMNPLAEEAGGSRWHGGGKHWSSQSAPEYQVLAAWVRGEAP